MEYSRYMMKILIYSFFRYRFYFVSLFCAVIQMPASSFAYNVLGTNIISEWIYFVLFIIVGCLMIVKSIRMLIISFVIAILALWGVINIYEAIVNFEIFDL